MFGLKLQGGLKFPYSRKLVDLQDQQLAQCMTSISAITRLVYDEGFVKRY